MQVFQYHTCSLIDFFGDSDIPLHTCHLLRRACPTSLWLSCALLLIAHLVLARRIFAHRYMERRAHHAGQMLRNILRRNHFRGAGVCSSGDRNRTVFHRFLKFGTCWSNKISGDSGTFMCRLVNRIDWQSRFRSKDQFDAQRQKKYF